MSNRKATLIFRHTTQAVSPWDTAITDAEDMIVKARARIAELKRAIETFKELKKSGHPFPGERKLPNKS